MFPRRIGGLTVTFVSLVFSQLNRRPAVFTRQFTVQLPGNNCFRKQGRAGRREDAGLNHSVFWCENNCFARLIQFLNKADKKYPPAQPDPARSQELICRLTCLAFLVAVWLMVFSYNYCPLITNKNQSRYSLEIISMEFSIGPQVQLNETDFIS